MSVYVIGAGGHAKVVIATLRAAGELVAGVVDDNPNKKGVEILGVPVMGTREEHRSKMRRAVIAVGDNAIRKMIAYEHAEVDWLTVVHPNAVVEDSVQLGAGTVVFAGAVIQPESCLGEHVIVNTAATVDHDCNLGSFVHIAPGTHIAGDVVVGEGALLGVGSAVIPGVAIGAWTTVGSGSVVVQDLPEGTKALGNPARPRN